MAKATATCKCATCGETAPETPAPARQPELIYELSIVHPAGRMNFRQLSHFFPMTQKDWAGAGREILLLKN